jgi:hypothetical protein
MDSKPVAILVGHVARLMPPAYVKLYVKRQKPSGLHIAVLLNDALEGLAAALMPDTRIGPEIPVTVPRNHCSAGIIPCLSE